MNFNNRNCEAKKVLRFFFPYLLTPSLPCSFLREGLGVSQVEAEKAVGETPLENNCHGLSETDLSASSQAALESGESFALNVEGRK